MSIRFEAKNKRGESLGLFPDDTIVIDEFFYKRDKLCFELKSDYNPAEVRIKVGNQWAERVERIFNLPLPTLERGRSGGIETQVYNRRECIERDYISILSRNLNEQQYSYLVEDLKRRLIDLTSDEETSVRSDDAHCLIEVYNKRLESIRDSLRELDDHFQELQRFPNRKVVKDYYLAPADKVSKVDSRTIRWQAAHGSRIPGKTMTFINVESYDVYENQFIVHILDRLNHYLSTLPKTFENNLDWKISELSRRKKKLTEYGRIDEEGIPDREKYEREEMKRLNGEIKALKKIKREKIKVYRSQTERMQQQIRQLRDMPFLTKIQPQPSFLLKPTLLLLRHPVYNAIYEGYLELEEKLKLEERQRIEEILDRSPIERTSKLYEYWVFLQVYEELLRMGFAPERSSENIENLLKRQGYCLREGNQLSLIGDADIYNRNGNPLKVRLHYEGNLISPLRPDVILEFTEGTKRYLLILDAKYKNYTDLGREEYKNDVVNTAYHKYKRLESNGELIESMDYVRDQISASFIIHSDSDRPLDYGSSGKRRNEYGAIPLVPNRSKFSSLNLKILLKMFMRMHLKRFDVCWSEGHEKPVRVRGQKKPGEDRADWERNYYCPVCHNRWWVNHCGHWCQKNNQGRDVPFPKISFKQMDFDNFFEVDESRMDGKRLLILF